MTFCRTIILATINGLILTGGTLASPAATTNSPDFKEVYGLLRAHLPGATDESLNQAAVVGLLAQLNGRASLVGNVVAENTNVPPVKATVLEQDVDYLRVSKVTDNLASQIGNANTAISATNKLSGTVLDLRFASGNAYESVKDAAARLVPTKMSVVVLINGETRGAAEVLAAELRNSGALLIGNPTAGLAMNTEDFALANGGHLRVATTPVKFHGVEMTRLQPDIAVRVTLADERSFQENPYGSTNSADNFEGGGTNNFTPLLDHTSEADLVRQKRKDGDDDENPEPPAKMEPIQPVLRDPALARAVDLVKGLAVMRESHP